MLQTTTATDTGTPPEDSEGAENATPVPGRRRYVASNLKNKTSPPASSDATPATATTHQLSVNFDLASPVADSDVRPVSYTHLTLPTKRIV